MSKLVLGAVCYAPKVVEIWEGFKEFFIEKGVPFDFVLYSNYEAQVEALIRKEIDIAWNSPLAWIRASRLAKANNIGIQAISMRDTDCDLRSIIIVRRESDIHTVQDLKGKIVSVGAIDSPQASLIPLQVLLDAGLSPHKDFTVKYNNILCGKHGDHVGGEEEAVKQLMLGKADAACLIEGNLSAFVAANVCKFESVRVLLNTDSYDHCNFTVIESGKAVLLEKFNSLLFKMDYADPNVRHLLDLEGLKKWKLGRTSEYNLLERAVDSFRFYDQSGALTEEKYVF